MVSLMTQEDVRALQQDDISINKELVKLTPNHEEKKGMTRGTKTSDTWMEQAQSLGRDSVLTLWKSETAGPTMITWVKLALTK